MNVFDERKFVITKKMQNRRRVRLKLKTMKMQYRCRVQKNLWKRKECNIVVVFDKTFKSLFNNKTLFNISERISSRWSDNKTVVNFDNKNLIAFLITKFWTIKLQWFDNKIWLKIKFYLVDKFAYFDKLEKNWFYDNVKYLVEIRNFIVTTRES